jgi:hypothetical protein
MKNFVKATLTAILTAQCTAVMIVQAPAPVGPDPFTINEVCYFILADFNPKIKGLQECTNVWDYVVPEGGCNQGTSEVGRPDNRLCIRTESKVNGAKFSESFIEQYDGNMDGTITWEELPEAFQSQRLFAHADADKNGKLSKKEIAKLGADYFEAKNMMKGAAFDKNGDGEITKNEVPEGMEGFFNGVDMDNSGVIDLVDLVLHRQKMRDDEAAWEKKS